MGPTCGMFSPIIMDVEIGRGAVRISRHKAITGGPKITVRCSIDGCHVGTWRRAWHRLPCGYRSGNDRLSPAPPASLRPTLSSFPFPLSSRSPPLSRSIRTIPRLLSFRLPSSSIRVWVSFEGGWVILSFSSVPDSPPRGLLLEARIARFSLLRPPER
ncbi:hypothetical protein C4D60_Mb08t29240 [Musa balbisiana]|uniref:Uncharacterized protein n=1 Tax=Musa balbisiana TaxID=52838 RepID=A0A4S8K7B8_MUSBA|nr:hypothetical protein C4D60_Mb08t29240 [Musa balbisiana]